MSVSVQTSNFRVQEEYQRVVDEAGDAGAVVLFTGLVREFHQSGSSKVQTLTLEHYPGMTEKALIDIEAQAHKRWPLLASRIVHRVGCLAAQDQIVLVVAASAHRGEAFAAAEFMMDYLKSRAPFWKKQARGDRSEWIESRESDADALRRWD